jgi:hypothetical protein
MIDISGNEIQFTLNEKILKRNFPVVAGSKEIIESLIKIL